MTPDNLPEIDDSALGVAALRAIETDRERPLVVDPLAARVLATGAPERQLVTRLEDADPHTREVASSIAVCGHAIDAFLRAGLDDGVTQLVILGAGLDNRAWRLAAADHVSVFELDRLEVMEFKRRVMTSIDARSPARHCMIGVDLRDDWPQALRDAGLRSQERSQWVAEGVLPQLPAATEIELLRRVDTLSPIGSRFALNHIGSDPGSVRAGMASMLDQFEVRNAEWSDEARADAGAWLNAHGWQVRESAMVDEAALVGRSLTRELELINRTRIVLARKACGSGDGRSKRERLVSTRGVDP